MSFWDRIFGSRTVQDAPQQDPAVDEQRDQTGVTRQERLETFIANQPEYLALQEPEDYPPTLIALEERFDPESRPPTRRAGFRRIKKLFWIGGRHG
jgi:hypothetical protein